MIEVYHADGRGQPLIEGPAVVPEQLDDTGWTWIDIGDEDFEVIRHATDLVAIPVPFVEEAVSNRHLPLVEEHPGFIYVVLNGFSTGQGTRLATTVVDVFLGPNWIITIHSGATPALDILRRRVAEGQLSPEGPDVLLGYLAMTGARNFRPLIDELENRIEDLEELAMQADPRALTEVHALRRDVIVLRRGAGPQQQVYEELAESNHEILDEESSRIFARAGDQQVRLIESLEASRSLLASVLETYRGAVADQTNEIVRVLTVFSAIVLPLSLIAGLWGMNFEVIPGVTNEWGFWILVGLMGLIALGLWWYFARRGFIGAPRARDLPKAVGLGILQMGTLPLRIVASGIESTVRHIGRAGDRSEEGSG